jgi:hypothetical protein
MSASARSLYLPLLLELEQLFRRWLFLGRALRLLGLRLAVLLLLLLRPRGRFFLEWTTLDSLLLLSAQGFLLALIGLHLAAALHFLLLTLLGLLLLTALHVLLLAPLFFHLPLFHLLVLALLQLFLPLPIHLRLLAPFFPLHAPVRFTLAVEDGLLALPPFLGLPLLLLDASLIGLLLLLFDTLLGWRCCLRCTQPLVLLLIQGAALLLPPLLTTGTGPAAVLHGRSLVRGLPHLLLATPLPCRALRFLLVPAR